MDSPTESGFFRIDATPALTTARVMTPRITDEDNVDQFGQSLVDLVDNDGVRRLLVDASNLEYVTSSVLGKLIHIHRKMERDGGRMVICCVQPTLFEILDATRLTTLFHMAKTEPAGRKLLDEA